MSGTTLQLGYMSPLTGAFGAHPQLGPVVDLNDGITLTLESAALQPLPRTVITAGNVRTAGERGVRGLFRHNRELRAQVRLGPMAAWADLAANLRVLIAWLAATPAQSVALKYQPMGASAPVYLDVVGSVHSITPDETQWLRLELEGIEITFVCRPFLRGDRVWLQNLVVNPGFEAPSGPGVTVFADSFTTANAYGVQAGGAPTLNPANTYVDTVLASAPGLLRYFRLDESSGTTAYDIAGAAQNGTINGGVTLGTAGLLSGDSDVAMTFNGSTGYISVPTTGLPTGNTPWTLGAWVKCAVLPVSGAFEFVLALGSASAGQAAQIGLYNNAGSVVAIADTSGGGVLGSSPIAANTAHFIVGTWDGATLRLYVDGALSGSMALSARNLSGASGYVGQGLSVGQFWNGMIDEPMMCGSALSAAQITTIYNAGASGATGALPNAMSIPSAGQVTFGSPAWQAINTWQVRWRWEGTGHTATFFPHFTDTSNNLSVSVAGGANGLTLAQKLVGSTTTLAQASAPLTQGVWYWLRVTQFPTPQGSSPAVSPPLCLVTLLADASGSPGVQLAQVSAAPTTVASALVSGKPAIATSGGPLHLGGMPTGHSLSLFGPGGWQVQNAGAGLCAGAWEGIRGELGMSGNAGATYPSGPVTSFGATRLDLPPAGQVDALWVNYTGGAPAASSAIPVSAAGDTFGWSVAARQQGLSTGATVEVYFNEYDSTGTFLRKGAGASVKGTAWARFGGTYVTGPACAFVGMSLHVLDSTSGSANGICWFDNAQVWDQTATGQAAMPYCELRFPQAPAQLMVSGMLGDVVVPAALLLGVYESSWAPGGAIQLAVGRKASAAMDTILIGNSNGWYLATGASVQSSATLDATAWGGWYLTATLNSSNTWNPLAFSQAPASLRGVYHLLQRYLSKETTITQVQVRLAAVSGSLPWYGGLTTSWMLGTVQSPLLMPLTNTNTWAAVDAGQLVVPAEPSGALTDLTQGYITPRPQWQDTTTTGAQQQINWQALLPVDASLLLGAVNNPGNSGYTASGWLWLYLDALMMPVGGSASATWSIESASLPAPGRGGGGPGTQSTGPININLTADPYLTLDPTLAANQLVASLADAQGAILPMAADIIYSPLYVEPR